ncbi:Glutaredoxin [Thalictrum thalictroides]|uniref:Glutaredoxin n=1 Tax=Thalictrum thalictroides TaxID=46969 RepID=A0A7J6WN69_THATH|nr:Glutaredoxin [Thalictrum thalictroides]
MGGVFSNSSSEEIAMALSKVKEIVSSNPVVVFSKTYCGYCNKVKQLFSQLNVSYKLIELDVESDGGEMQSALAQWTGQRTVPNVFIGGKHIGGCDAVMALNKEGKLVPLLTEVGALAQASSERTVGKNPSCSL